MAELKAAIPRKRRKAERPGEILEAALKLFLAHGYFATRLDDVAALAGVGKGTLYNYFDNKEQLFLSVIEHNTQCQADVAITMIGEHPGSMESLIKTLLTTWWDKVLSKATGDLFKIIITESASFPTIARFYLDSVIAPLQAFLADVVRRGVANGEFRQIDADTVSNVLSSNFLKLALWRVTFDHGTNVDDPARTVETTLDVYLCGLRGPTQQNSCFAGGS